MSSDNFTKPGQEKTMMGVENDSFNSFLRGWYAGNRGNKHG